MRPARHPFGFCSPRLPLYSLAPAAQLLTERALHCVRSFAKALLRSMCPGAEDGRQGQGAIWLDDDALVLFADQILTVTPENAAAGHWEEIKIDRDFFSKANIESMVPFLFYCK